MGFRYRKSIKLMPGVRMNISNRGIGYSVGLKGARVSRSATGRTYRTLSLPGTGISHTQRLGGSSRGNTSTGGRGQSAPTAALPPRPGIFAAAAEKELYKAVLSGTPDPSMLPRIGRAHPDYRVLAAALEGFLAFQGGQHVRARQLLAWVFAQREEISLHAFARKYLAGASVTVEVAYGVSAALPIGRSTVGLAVAELHQEAGDLEAAIKTVEQIDPPTAIAALSLAELYVDAGRYADVVDITDGLTNADDVTALLCVFRGVGLREQGFQDAAREAFKEALRSRSRSAEVRHRAYIERGLTHLAQNKPAMARKDLERVLAEDSDIPGLREALAQLPR